MTSADPLAGLSSLEGVGSAMAAARDGIDALLRDRGLRRTTPDRTAESLLLGAHASAVLDGSASSLDEVRRGAGDATARAALRVSAELLALVPTLAASPIQAIARLHVLAAKGQVADDALGRPRDADAAARLRDLAATLSTPTTAPALVVASVAHAEIVASAPFASHNGLVGRALERALLVGRGVDPTSLTVPEAGHLALRAAYQSNLEAYSSGSLAGVQAWLRYASEAFARGAEASPLT